MKKSSIALLIMAMLMATSTLTFSQNRKGGFGIRAGLGTDINFGLGYGFGINYLFPKSSIELSAILFGHHSEETTEETHKYEEKTDLFVYGILANYLIGYKHKKLGVFGIVGFGFSAVSVDWEEQSNTDTSLGTPLPGGGSKQTASGTGGGSVVNAGFGYSFGQVILRAEFPVIIAFSPPGKSSTAIPTFIATLGFNF